MEWAIVPLINEPLSAISAKSAEIEISWVLKLPCQPVPWLTQLGYKAISDLCYKERSKASERFKPWYPTACCSILSTLNGQSRNVIYILESFQQF